MAGSRKVGNFELTAPIILARCQRIIEAPARYDFPNRVKTCEQYDALISLFARLDFNKDPELLAGALAVYGWMPTMMDDLQVRDGLKSLIADLAKGDDAEAPTVLAGYQGTGALRAVNNSIVGTSKLLHFFFPQKVPIWDSVLARSFDLVHHHQFNREDRFTIYANAVHEAARSSDVAWDRLKIASASNSRIRHIEFALYAFGRLTPEVKETIPLGH